MGVRDSSADYLLSIPAVRECSTLVKPRILNNELLHFDVDTTAFHDSVVPAVVSTIKSYVHGQPYTSIPPHGRWQHFSVGGVRRLDDLISSWHDVDDVEKVRRVIDLTLVSVLLDAGAGNAWKYHERNGSAYSRSEGLAVASLHMFTSGVFSSDTMQPCQADAQGLAYMTEDALAQGLQVTPSNPIEGLAGRAQLLRDLGAALRNFDLFGGDGRPGNMLTFLQSGAASGSSQQYPTIQVEKLWHVLSYGLGSIWPTRTRVEDRSIGDAWHYDGLPESAIIPFHKLTQWLCYSLLIPLKSMLHANIVGEELLTGLPEYRNGGLLIDYGALTLKSADAARGFETAKSQDKANGLPWFTTDDDVIVEWRAVTVVLLDMLLPEVNKALGLQGEEALSLAQMLEAGSWAAGREIAKKKRPETGGPPVCIVSDGTVF